MDVELGANPRRLIGASLVPIFLALSTGCLLGNVASAENEPSTAAESDSRNESPTAPRSESQDESSTTPTSESRPSRQKGLSIEGRVKGLAKALDLDPTQQANLRKVLEEQREQIRSVWADTTVPAPHRVGATQAISDKTADRIRALLNDEQKKRYNPPKPHRPPPDTAGRSVEDWMDAARKK